MTEQELTDLIMEALENFSPYLVSSTTIEIQVGIQLFQVEIREV